MRLLYYANKARIKTDNGWDFPEWVTVPQAKIMSDLGIKERRKLYRIETELTSAGFVEISKSKGREPTRYRIVLPTAEASASVSVKCQKQGSFDTDDFFLASVKKSFGDDFDPRILEK